jgi:ABC-type nitrate/sulfonate/bicarbonate transport system ATPase subunit
MFVFGLKHSKKYSDQPKKHLQKIAIHALQEAGLHNSANKYPHQLSGGMHQRATLARAFSGHPQLLLMDEPFASIDSIGRKELQNFLLALRQEYGTSVIFVTHDIQEALKLGDRILVLNQKGEHLLEADPHQADFGCRLNRQFNMIHKNP